MFAHQIRRARSCRRGAGEQRGHRRMACRRRGRRPRQPGAARARLPTGHRAAQVCDEHLAADLVIALGRNHLRMLTDLGVEPERLRMLRSFDPRSGAHPLDVEDPYYGDHADFEEAFTVIEAALPGCTPGSTNAWPMRDSRADAALEFRIQAGLGGPGARRGGVRLPVLHRAGTLAAGQEHQDLAGEPSDPGLAERRPGAGDGVAAAPGFVGARCPVAPGDGHRALPTCRCRRCSPGSGSSGLARLRGAGALRRRRRARGCSSTGAM